MAQITNPKIKNLANKRFGRLVVLHYTQSKNHRSHWWCKCDCGNELEVDANRLNRKLRQSCGCLSLENSLINIKKAHQINTIYSPTISTARSSWRNYLNMDRQCTLTFEQWYDVCQKNCHYCGIEPSNTFNVFVGKIRASSRAINEGNFCYNGLDRIDSSKHHSIDNIVACCWVCNRAKHNRSVEDFIIHISSIKLECLLKPFIVPKLLLLPEKHSHLPDIKRAYSYYLQNYGKMEVDLQIFYTYSQMKCFYCNVRNSNGKQWKYNGVDRIDSKLDHRMENIVPCCKWCNISKGELSVREFGGWIDRLQKYQKMMYAG